MNPKTEKILLVAGGAILLYLIFFRKTNVAGNGATTGAEQIVAGEETIASAPGAFL
jgi:hypothetical protein